MPKVKPELSRYEWLALYDLVIKQFIAARKEGGEAILEWIFVAANGEVVVTIDDLLARLSEQI